MWGRGRRRDPEGEGEEEMGRGGGGGWLSSDGRAGGCGGSGTSAGGGGGKEIAGGRKGGRGGRRSDHLTWRKPDSHLGRIQTSALAPLSFGLPSKQQNFYKSGIFWLRKSGLGVKKTGFFERFFFLF